VGETRNIIITIVKMVIKKGLILKMLIIDFIAHLSSLTITPSIAALYKQIVKDVFNSKEETKEEQINKLNRSLNLIIEKSQKLDDAFLSGNILAEDYNRMNRTLKEKQRDTNQNIDELKNKETNLEKYFSYGLYLLTNLDFHYENAPLEIKHKLVGSIFPEKLIYSNNNYRTTKSNSFVSLITSKSKELKRIKNKKATISSGLSNLAPLLGLEPRTVTPYNPTI
jgi:site-specific DNA recombinase